MPTHHWLRGKRIAVAGAGISGLAAVIALHKQWPTICPDSTPPVIRIYERDVADDILGRQGYSMSIRSDPPGGMQALQKLGLLDTMLEASITGVPREGEDRGGFCMWDVNWNNILRIAAKPVEGLPVSTMRIARKNMRAILIRAVEDLGVDIQWATGCASVSRHASGHLQLQLSNGSTADCDIVIAADGASSKLRSQLRPDDTLIFQKVVVLGGTTRFGSAAPPAPIDKDWGLMPTGRRSAMFAAPVDEHSALWSVNWCSNTPVESKSSPMSDADAASTLALAKEKAREGGLPQSVLDLIDKTDPTSLMLFNARDKMPFAHPANDAFPEVIFIGDANHAVSPFAGNGAGMALCDGWDIAAELGKASSLEEGLRAYDALVVPRSKRVIKMSHVSMSIGFSSAWPLWFYTWILTVVQFSFRQFAYLRGN